MARVPDHTTTQSNGDKRIPVWLTGDPAYDSTVLADALARSDALLNIDSNLMAITSDGTLKPVGHAVLQELAARHLAGQRVVNHGTTANPDYAIVEVPVDISEQVLRNMLRGMDLRKGMPLPGGSLVDRVPKVQSVRQAPAAA